MGSGIDRAGPRSKVGACVIPWRLRAVLGPSWVDASVRLIQGPMPVELVSAVLSPWGRGRCVDVLKVDTVDAVRGQSRNGKTDSRERA